MNLRQVITMLKTEMRNPDTMHIDRDSTLDMMKKINNENMNAVKAVENALEEIALAVDRISERFNKGGRIFYMGAGTSGRLGVLDAAECPPTFGIEKGRVVGIMAGGDRCVVTAGESNEDSPTAGVEDLKKYDITENDTVIGISAAGGAKYVLCALEYAKSTGALTVGITSNEGTPIFSCCDLTILTDTGAEVITGSTRMKAGTAQKIVLNMISTGVMVKCGYVYENLMINLKPSNEKLKRRMISIVSDIKDISLADAEALLEQNGWNIRQAVEIY